VMKEPNPAKAGEFFVNVVGILPLPAGAPAPHAPVGFIRQKDKPQTQAGPQGRPVQTYAQAPQQAPNSVSLNAPAAGQPEAF